MADTRASGERLLFALLGLFARKVQRVVFAFDPLVDEDGR